MTKVFVLGVSGNAFSNPDANSMVVALEESDLTRIRRLAEAVKDLGVLKIAETDYSTYWLSDTVEDLQEDFRGRPLALLKYADENEESVDIPQRVVYDDQVTYTAIPKHGSDAELMTSESIPFRILFGEQDTQSSITFIHQRVKPRPSGRGYKRSETCVLQKEN